MDQSSVQALPADLFHLLAAELQARSDFATLYNCVVSSKYLANSGAVAALYRISHESPVKGGGSEELPLYLQDQQVQRWSILWRTIILSALGQTMFPYCRHLRMLDLRDLGYLLDDDKFKQRKIATKFFAGPLARFNLVIDTPLKKGSKTRPKRLDLRSIISSIGDTISLQAPLLDSLTEPIIGDIFSSALLAWAPRLEHLRRLDLWDGRALADETVRNLLHVHCPNIDSLRIYQITLEDADHQLATFISGMRQNKLMCFENLSNCRIGPETCLALNHHGKSLSVLKLALTEDGILALGTLQGCTSIQTLAVDSLRPSVDLKATQNDVFVDIVEWLKTCTSLRDVSFKDLVSAPDLLTPILLNDKVSLHSLQINANEGSMYVVRDHHDFHRALSKQSSLRELFLRADPEPASRDDIETLMNAICSLQELRTLNLTRISDYFSDKHINLLTQHLPNLEDLYIGGYGISDAVWDSLFKLANLRIVTFSGLTNFTTAGILSFVSKLGEGNRGLLLSIDLADPESALSEEEQNRVRDTLATGLDGRFNYQLLRDPNMPEFDDSEDSD